MKETNDILGHFIRRFTIIDFLGYLIPGMLVTLSLDQRLNHIFKEPFTMFFGEQPVLLAIYFIIVSYMVGIIIHEISKVIEKIVDHCYFNQKLEGMERSWNVEDNYRRMFLEDNLNRTCGEQTENQRCAECLRRICDSIQVVLSVEDENKGEACIKCAQNILRDVQEVLHNIKASNEPECVRRFRKIYRYVQPQLEDTKVPLMRAFSTLGRTGAVAVPMIALLNWIELDPVSISNFSLWQFVLVVVITTTLLHRYVRFRKIVVEYVYSFFDKISREKKLMGQVHEDGGNLTERQSTIPAGGMVRNDNK